MVIDINALNSFLFLVSYIKIIIDDEEEEYYVKKGKDYEAGYMSNPSDEEDNPGLDPCKEPLTENKLYTNETRNSAYFDNVNSHSPKSNRSRSRIKKPTKNLITFDDFLNSNQ